MGPIDRDRLWPKVYDVAEYLVEIIEEKEQYVRALNEAFLETGAGWQYVAGEGIIIRGEELFEASVQEAMETLDDAGYGVAKKELKEALHDISR